VVDAELDRIEKQFALLQEETSVSSDPSALTARLDGLTQSLQDTSRWLNEHTEFFRSIDEPVGPIAVPTAGQPLKE
jgi:hypothetical protein